MLDDINVLAQRDPGGALKIAGNQYKQAEFKVDIQYGENDARKIDSIVVAGMGGSALAALLVNTWLKTELDIPFEVVRTYNLPAYVGKNTLVIASSYSGNTEETLSCLAQAKTAGSQIAIIAAAGKLEEDARKDHMAFVSLPGGIQPRMAMIYNLCALVALFENFGVIKPGRLDEIAKTSSWLKSEVDKWAGEVPTGDNYAKQLAMLSVGKSAEFFGGTLTAPLAYKWKISWNENAKNVAFWNEYPEMNHNEFMGWTSHPIEKPFVIFDIVSNLEHPQILKRFEVSDRLLSGMRPKSTVIKLAGQTLIEQMLWGCILADFVSIYLAILNGVNPIPVQLIEKLKLELADN
ncbi:bifunctional phosphoglucose/phosphomannose isomerase [Candidatus Saccharibacteria bacterium]|nr:bifunctional phosphoglucose/phosphomannose isomerase [Candidatus Saccharibacteria bacterium]